MHMLRWSAQTLTRCGSAQWAVRRYFVDVAWLVVRAGNGGNGRASFGASTVPLFRSPPDTARALSQVAARTAALGRRMVATVATAAVSISTVAGSSTICPRHSSASTLGTVHQVAAGGGPAPTVPRPASLCRRVRWSGCTRRRTPATTATQHLCASLCSTRPDRASCWPREDWYVSSLSSLARRTAACGLTATGLEQGGKGNTNFATGAHRSPQESTDGEQGERYRVRLELRLIAVRAVA